MNQDRTATKREIETWQEQATLTWAQKLNLGLDIGNNKQSGNFNIVQGRNNITTKVANKEYSKEYKKHLTFGTVFYLDPTKLSSDFGY